MAMNGLQGVLDCLEKGVGAIEVAEVTRLAALACIERMLAFTARHRLTTTTPVGGFVPAIGAA
jgi:quinolinate synthase